MEPDGAWDAGYAAALREVVGLLERRLAELPAACAQRREATRLLAAVRALLGEGASGDSPPRSPPGAARPGSGAMKRDTRAARLQAIRDRYRWDKAWGVDDLLAMLDEQQVDAELGAALRAVLARGGYVCLTQVCTGEFHAMPLDGEGAAGATDTAALRALAARLGETQDD